MIRVRDLHHGDYLKLQSLGFSGSDSSFHQALLNVDMTWSQRILVAEDLADADDRVGILVGITNLLIEQTLSDNCDKIAYITILNANTPDATSALVDKLIEIAKKKRCRRVIATCHEPFSSYLREQFGFFENNRESVNLCLEL